jgi:hypothetical protein
MDSAGFGGAALATSVCLISIELLTRWIDHHRHGVKYCTKVQYLFWHACLFVLTIVIGSLGIAGKRPPYLIGSYEAALVHMAGLQVSTSWLSAATTNSL